MSAYQEPRHTKAQVREAVRSARTTFTGEQWAQWDATRTTKILKKLRSLRPTCVAAYASRDHEPDTMDLLWELHDMEIPVLLPVFPHGITVPDWALWQGEELGEGPMGIAQPLTPPLGSDALTRADVIIVPGLAGTMTGSRLGMGGGWYDQALTHARDHVPMWLLLNDNEVVDSLPQEPHDITVTSIVTEKRWIDCP